MRYVMHPVWDQAAASWFAWMAAMSWQVAVLAFVVWMVTRVFRRTSAAFRFALWGLVLIKLAVPPHMATPWSVGNLTHLVPSVSIDFTRDTATRTPDPASANAGTAVQPKAAVSDAERNIPAEGAAVAGGTKGGDVPPSPSGASATAMPAETLSRGSTASAGAATAREAWSWRVALMALWSVVAAGMLLSLSMRALRYQQRVARDLNPLDQDLQTMVDSLAAQLGLGSRFDVRVSPHVSTPTVCLLRRPTVLLPAALLNEITPEHFVHLMGHELAHIKRRDLQLGWVAALLLCLYWFHPAVWFAAINMRREREMACDDEVLYRSRPESKAYAATILKVAESFDGSMPAGSGFLGLFEVGEHLLQRIRSISDASRPRRAGVKSFITVIAAAALLVPMGIWTTTSVAQTRGAGPSNTVLRFDGQNDYIAIAPDSRLDLTRDVSVSVWARVAPNQGEAPIFFRGDTQLAMDPYALGVTGATMWFRMDLQPGQAEGTRAIAYAPVDDAWHHWVGVRDAQVGRIRLYMDGRMVNEAAATSSISYPTSGMDNSIGAIDHGAWQTWGFLSGEVDQLSVWNVARTPDQIQQEFREGLRGDEPGLVAYWTFDEDGQRIRDHSRSGIHATLGSSAGADANDPARVAASTDTAVILAAPTLAEAQPVPPPAPLATVPSEAESIADRQPGDLIFQGQYHHRSRGGDISQPSVVWAKRTSSGEVILTSYLPPFNTTYVAFVRPGPESFYRYESYSHGREGQPPSSRVMEMSTGRVTVRTTGGEHDGEVETYAVPESASLEPNSRPDPYAAHMALLLYGMPTSTQEFDVYDWDNTGEGMASYRIRLEYVGQENVTVPAGTFSAHHFVETQLTFGDTWFKKRPGHVTDYWALDNGVMVRILRHREPYELLLESAAVPEPLPGRVAGSVAPVAGGALEIVQARYGAGSSWVDVTEVLRGAMVNNVLEVWASNDLAGDPIYGTPKALEVHYRIDGKDFATTVPETQMLRLPPAEAPTEIASIPSPADARIAAVEEEIAQHYAAADNETKEYIRWTAGTFGRSALWQAASAFHAMPDDTREQKVQRMVEVLNGEYGRHLCPTLADAGALRDARLLPGLMKQAAYHREDSDYDCRPKWMAVSALGRQDDISAVPTLIPLVDHGNQNTRMWARASLARLTGQWFGDDKKAWARWWNETGHAPQIDESALRPWVPVGETQAASPAPAPAPAQQPAQDRAWGPEQAAGAPNTPQAGDMRTAWASRGQDDQVEWLLVEYAAPVEATRIDVYETYNPGALIRVTSVADDGVETELWRGTDPTPQGSGLGVSKIMLPATVRLQRLKLYIDSPSVQGWNEIDAVGLVDTQETMHWAVKASASSTYAEPKAEARATSSASPAEPELVSVSPEIGATEVDPATAEIRVTFDQDMDTTGYSWTGSGEVYPKTTGKPVWTDARTCVLPVQLEPAKFYRVGINAKDFRSFRGVNGVAARDRVVYFATQGLPQGEWNTLAAPAVVSLDPPNGATNASPATTWVTITFDKPMGGGLAWCTIDEHFPETTGKAAWSDDKMVCRLPVALKPNTVYRIGLNIGRFNTFQSEAGVPMKPVVWEFRTGSQ